MSLATKSVLIIGYGKVGSGLADMSRKHGANVSIIEIDPVRQVLSKAKGFTALPPHFINDLLPHQDIIISCTSNYEGHSLGIEQLLLMHDGAIVFNAGSGHGEIAPELARLGEFEKHHAKIIIQAEGDDLRCVVQKMDSKKEIKILSSGYPINLRNQKGTPEDIIDLVFSAMLLAAIKAKPDTLHKSINNLDYSIETEVANLFKTNLKDKTYSPVLMHSTDLELDERPYGGVVKFGLPSEHLSRFSLARAMFRPKSQTEGHYHSNSEEAYFIEQGTADMIVWHYLLPEEKAIYHLKVGDYLTIPTGFFHKVSVTSDEDFVCLVIASPPFSIWDQFFS